MKVKFPKYYKNFACIGESCTDNCCIGWEIDIDPKTRERYRCVGGELGERMKKSIADEEGQSHFILCGERCPFLNEKNLCDIIIGIGKVGLCDICRLHPRYFSRFGEIAFGGVGLCCEAAAELILSEDTEHTYCDFDFDEVFDDEYDEEIFELISGKKQALVDIMRDNSLNIGERLELLMSEAERIQTKIDGFEGSCDALKKVTLYEYFDSLEHLDGELMGLLKKCEGARKKPLTSEQTRYVSNFAIYFIDRYFCEGARDGDIIGKVAFAVLSSALFALLLTSDGDSSLSRAVHIAKCYSKEIEYSEENVERIMTESEALYLAKELLQRI